ncbi:MULTISPECIES: universal stress protein [Brevundimonas]|uniref:universal stress protein n=1 Tax=Brevundimonas TaxID=41275 RepID=UPI000627C7DD|nr:MULTISPECIES: universal stress protein [Brevundimonas]MBN9479516.1 universal stress protein [Bordetella sp.]OMG58395.1 universal stress protein UspA [Brevundimonas sp. ZS04]
MTKVLACIDASTYGASVCDHAAWAAQNLNCDVELLHVLDRAPDAVPQDLSGSIGLGTSEHLLEDLAKLDEHRGKLRMERGRAILEAAKSRVEAAGVGTVTTRLRHGGLVDNVHELEDDVRLVVLGKRGERSDFAKAHLGGSIEQVVRATKLPVLIASREFKPIQRLLIAFDGGASSRKAVDFLVSDPAFSGFECHVVMAGHPKGDDAAHLAWARDRLAGGGGNHQVLQRDGEPETVITDYVRDEKIDLLVMGAYGHSPIRRFFVGSTTTAMIRIALLPVLLFR